MTMLVDRRKDNYDELLVLANDARASRARVNRWSTAMVVGAMAATAAYVAAMNEQVEELRQNAGEAAARYEQIVDERDLLRAEWEALARYQDLYANIIPTQDLNKSITRVVERLGPGTAPAGEATFALSNIVWMVDGSRRFPMTNGDILWIPEGNFWIQLVGDSVAEHKLFLARSEPVGSTTATLEELSLPVSMHAVTVNSTDCIEVRLHEKSLRPAFRNTGYVDVEVTYISRAVSGECGSD